MTLTKIREALGGRHEGPAADITRIGSAQLGIVVLRMDQLGTITPTWMGELGKFGWSIGLAGVVEAGIYEIPNDQVSWRRIRYLPNCRALGTYWAHRNGDAA